MIKSRRIPFLSMRRVCRGRFINQVVLFATLSSFCLVRLVYDASAIDVGSFTGPFSVTVGWPTRGEESEENQDDFAADDEDSYHDNGTAGPIQKKATEQTISTKTQTKDFLSLCKSAMGVETILEIQTFEYYDYTKELSPRTLLDDWDNDDDITIFSQDETPLSLFSVRGLAASRDIAVGEVVIEIPLLSLLSVPTTIDRDPLLSNIMGPTARKKHGWVTTSMGSDGLPMDTIQDPEAPFVYELALLAVALLYHKNLRENSPLNHYISVLEATPVDTMPFLWSRDKMQRSPLFFHDGIRSVASGIRRDIRDMYKSVVRVLLNEHPDVFTTEMVSFTEFEWAFAIVNSRHWQLQIDDLDADYLSAPHKHTKSQVSVEDQLPPAETPTDSWVREHEEFDEGIHSNEEELGQHGKGQYFLPSKLKVATKKHFFLAPVADLLNFGPPCTRGHYNTETKTFQIISTCPFRKGQEVTFWYSDECDHIMIGKYGFTHPVSNL